MTIVQIFFHIILLSWPVYSLAQKPPIAKNGCTDHCGNISIPYPFGIGANCFIDDSFEIVCDDTNSSSPLATLNSVQRNVLEISVKGTILVSGNVLMIDCVETCPFSAFEGDLPVISETAVLQGGGVRPFLAVNVPVLLKWGLYNHNEMNNSTENTSSSYCITSILNANSSTNQSTKLECYCRSGYDGNPYLLQGCQDINECQDKSTNPCSYGFNQSYECINYEGSYRCLLPKESKIKLITIGICTGVVGLSFLLVGAWSLYKVIKKRKDNKLKQKFFKRNGGLLLQQQLSSGEVNVEKIKMFNSKELEKATDHFNVDRMLGQGGQGTVYKGMLTDGEIVAVKKSKVVDGGKLQQFINEVVILSQINHRNVVKLFGCCLETEVPLLVYEFIPNGTLYQYLHDQNEEFPLTWDVRLRIATEIAGALSYLHNAASLPIYHRDIKSLNILLDDKYRAKVADFGCSRSVAIDKTHVTTLVQGTFGYLDPEYFRSSKFTEKSDVYSFGVVLVELLTGQKSIFSTRTQEAKSLAMYFILLMEENNLCDILDAQVTKEDRNEEVMVVAKLAERCLNLNGKKRPTMKEVTMELEGIQKSQKDLIDSQNYEEVNARTEMVEPSDVSSTSTGSGLDSGIGSSFEVRPLYSNNVN